MLEAEVLLGEVAEREVLLGDTEGEVLLGEEQLGAEVPLGEQQEEVQLGEQEGEVPEGEQIGAEKPEPKQPLQNGLSLFFGWKRPRDHH